MSKAGICILLATADIHLGASEENWKTHPGSSSPDEAWRLTILQCIELKADILLIAGDLIDLDANFANISKDLVKGFSELEKASIDVVLITGNHDYDLLPLFLQAHPFEHVTLLGADGNWEAIVVEKHGIQFGIAGRSFPEIGQKTDPLIGAVEVLENAPHPLIAMLHCDTKRPESIYGYMEVERLIELPVDAWILGHLHEPEILNEIPVVFYPGNPGKRSAKTKRVGPVSIEILNTGLTTPTWLDPMSNAHQ